MGTFISIPLLRIFYHTDIKVRQYPTFFYIFSLLPTWLHTQINSTYHIRFFSHVKTKSVIIQIKFFSWLVLKEGYVSFSDCLLYDLLNLSFNEWICNEWIYNEWIFNEWIFNEWIFNEWIMNGVSSFVAVICCLCLCICLCLCVCLFLTLSFQFPSWNSIFVWFACYMFHYFLQVVLVS